MDTKFIGMNIRRIRKHRAAPQLYWYGGMRRKIPSVRQRLAKRPHGMNCFDFPNRVLHIKNQAVGTGKNVSVLLEKSPHLRLLPSPAAAKCFKSRHHTLSASYLKFNF